jgi:MFS family permease
MPSNTAQSAGLRAFVVVWFGQMISLLGTSLTRYAVTLWAWELTGQATALSLAAFFGFVPLMLMSPFAGALVDRWNRKLVIMLSDFGAAGSALLLLLLSATGNLEIWHVYVASFIAGIFEAFQFPAYSAAVTTMVDRSQYARTSAMIGIAETATGILAPILATALYATIKLPGILVIDVTTCIFAITTVFFARIPQPPVTQESQQEGKGNLLREAAYGFRYIRQRPSLLGLQLVFFFGNLLYTLFAVLMGAMILARTGNDQIVLRDVSSTMAVGGLVSGLIISAWGGPKRRILGVLIGWSVSGIIPIMVMGLGRTTPVWMLAGFVGSFLIAIVNPCNQAIWQSKVPPHLQGRVFSARRFIAQVTSPLAMLVAGPLADYVFEPAMQSGGLLATAFGPLVGTGPGAGIALMYLVVGVLVVMVGIVGYFVPAIRNVEDLVPDHVATEPVATELAGGSASV